MCIVFFSPWIHTLRQCRERSEDLCHVSHWHLLKENLFPQPFFLPRPLFFSDSVDWHKIWHDKLNHQHSFFFFLKEHLSGSCGDPGTACTFIYLISLASLSMKCQMSVGALDTFQMCCQSISGCLCLFAQLYSIFPHINALTHRVSFSFWRPCSPSF